MSYDLRQFPIQPEKINNENTPKPLDNPDTIPDNLTMGGTTMYGDNSELTIISDKQTEVGVPIHKTTTAPITIQQQQQYSKWYDSGANAKKKGFTRTSPYYERPTADYFFYCGFDGVKFEDAVLNLEDAMKAFNKTALKQEQPR